MSIFDFKRKKYRTFLQDSETGEEIAEEYEKGRGVWKKHDVQEGKGSEMRENLIRKHYWFSGRVQGVGFRYRIVLPADTPGTAYVFALETAGELICRELLQVGRTEVTATLLSLLSGTYIYRTKRNNSPSSGSTDV